MIKTFHHPDHDIYINIDVYDHRSLPDEVFERLSRLCPDVDYCDCEPFPLFAVDGSAIIHANNTATIYEVNQ